MSNIRQTFLYQWISVGIKKILIKANPIWEINRCYKKVFNGKLPDLKNPQNLIEKIYWMELHTDTSLWSKCTDKYLMREYVADCGYADFLPKLLAKWNKAKDINFSELPEEFILKTNNGCGTCYIVKDKKKEDLSRIKKLFKKWLRIQRVGYTNAQLHYLKITPCIIAEELLHASKEDSLISPASLIDYKVWCFSGKPECILVTYDRKDDRHFVDMYDLDWNRKDDCINKTRANFKQTPIPKPKCLQQMLEMASVLSKPFSEVRVDFYIVNSIPIVGELTFSTGYGNYTEKMYDYLGSLVDLSRLKIVR